MTRRDRLEAKVARRQEWARKADARSAASFERTNKLADSIPLGQPILVGHHSERHARADAERIRNGTTRGVEEARLANYHERKADGLAHQLDHSIFSDDEDAVEALQARIAEREEKASRMVAVNAAWRKAKGDPEAFARLAEPLGISPTEAKSIAYRCSEEFQGNQPHASWEITNLRASIRRDKDRLAGIVKQQERTERAEASASGVIVEGGEWVRVTFAEKPARSVLDDLKAAGFRWGQGSWIGERAKLPESVSSI